MKRKLILLIILVLSIEVPAIDGLLLECKKGNTVTHYFEFSVPIKEKISQHGPFVMNTQTEILEAMRDFQDGKMGHLY